MHIRSGSMVRKRASDRESQFNWFCFGASATLKTSHDLPFLDLHDFLQMPPAPQWSPHLSQSIADVLVSLCLCYRFSGVCFNNCCVYCTSSLLLSFSPSYISIPSAADGGQLPWHTATSFLVVFKCLYHQVYKMSETGQFRPPAGDPHFGHLSGGLVT